MPKTVVVLEDTSSRVVWLRDFCAMRGAAVEAFARVQPFLKHMELHTPDIVVLDHDLGGFLMPLSLQDADGLNGLDAVESLVLTQCKGPRYLVWSTNHVEAPRMQGKLVAIGATVARYSWSEQREQISEQLTEWLRR